MSTVGRTHEDSEAESEVTIKISEFRCGIAGIQILVSELQISCPRHIKEAQVPQPGKLLKLSHAPH